MSVILIQITGIKTESESKAMAWMMMCEAHPHESFVYDPERFWEYFHSKCPQITRPDMEKMLKFTEAVDAGL